MGLRREFELKLYFYFLKSSFMKPPVMYMEECEVIEKPKTFSPLDRFPSGYYGRYVPKSGLNTLITRYGWYFISDERKDEEAVKAILEHCQNEIQKLEEKIAVFRQCEQAAREWRSSENE